MKIDRIELADCGSPEKLIAEILRQVPEMPIPVPIEELAAAVDITAIHRMTTNGFEGGLVTQAERRDGIILVNGGSSPERQRFTIGHELGHYLIMSHEGVRTGHFTCQKEDMALRKADRDNRAMRMEVEANRFAAGILMPLLRFKPQMRELGSPDLEHVLALAGRYQTSMEATAFHYAIHHDDPCAIILSKGGVVRRVYKPVQFPFIETARGRPLPFPSFTMQLPADQRIGWGDVDHGVWLSRQDGRRCLLQEQALRYGGGWMMTLLTYDPLEVEAEDEIPDALSVWESPRFPSRTRRR